MQAYMQLCAIALVVCSYSGLVIARESHEYGMYGGKQDESDRPCFSTEFEASSIGSLLTAELWRGIQATGCEDHDAIFEVYQKHFAEDFVFTSPFPEIAANSLEEYRVLAVDSGVDTRVCQTTYLSYAVANVELIDDNTFVWNANEIFSPPFEELTIPNGRSATIQLDDKCRAKIIAFSAVDEFET